MSIKVMTYVWEHSTHKGSELLTLLAIADFAHDDGTNAWPSIKALSEKTRMSERTVQLVLKKLEQSQELGIERNAGPYGCHLFKVNMWGAKITGGAKITPLKKAKSKQSVIKYVGAKITGGVQRLQGEEITPGVKNTVEKMLQIAPEPLLDPSDREEERETTSLSSPGVETAFPSPGMEVAEANGVSKPKREKRLVRKLPVDDWLWLELQHYTAEFDVAMLNDADWWDNVANSFPVFDRSWVPLAFASLAQWQQANPTNRCRSERGWKKRLNYSLNFYYDKHMRRQAYAKTPQRVR